MISEATLGVTVEPLGPSSATSRSRSASRRSRSARAAPASARGSSGTAPARSSRTRTSPERIARRIVLSDGRELAGIVTARDPRRDLAALDRRRRRRRVASGDHRASDRPSHRRDRPRVGQPVRHHRRAGTWRRTRGGAAPWRAALDSRRHSPRARKLGRATGGRARPRRRRQHADRVRPRRRRPGNDRRSAFSRTSHRDDAARGTARVIRTLVAAASPVVRAGLEALLTRSASVAVVAITSGDTLADDVEAHEPQVVLFAVDARDGSASALVSRIALSPDAVSRSPRRRAARRRT